jgi:hypothetical protein
MGDRVRDCLGMTESLVQTGADFICRHSYVQLAQECRLFGFSYATIEKSRALAERIDGRNHLKVEAYKPTGIALGCPLGCQQLADRLWHLAEAVEERLTALCPGKGPSFASVPPAWYHITLVNREHYDVTPTWSTEGGGGVITAEERDKAQSIVSQTGCGPIAVDLKGAILPRNGKLFVPGFPCDLRFYALRARLTEGLPRLAVNTPRTAHVKLGHVLVCLEKPAIEAFLDWLSSEGLALTRLTFREAYSAAGQISL